MLFLKALALELSKWLLEKGGRWAIEFFKDFFKKKEQKEVAGENTEEYKKAVDAKDDEKRKEAGRRIINGEKK